MFACDAGMGSSAMGASVLRRKIQAAGHGDVTVVNKAIANLTDTYDLVVTHQDLTDRAQLKTPSAIHVSVDNFMGSPRYDEIVDADRPGAGAGGAAVADAVRRRSGSDVLAESSIVLDGTARSRDDAITEAGQLLVAAGAVDPSYVDAMHERETSVSTHMGNLLAIPHGTNEAKGAIRRTAISFVRYPGQVDWNGKPAEFVIGIAGAGNDHLGAAGEDRRDLRRLGPGRAAAPGADAGRGPGGAELRQGLTSQAPVPVASREARPASVIVRSAPREQGRLRRSGGCARRLQSRRQWRRTARAGWAARRWESWTSTHATAMPASAPSAAPTGTVNGMTVSWPTQSPTPRKTATDTVTSVNR